MNSITYTPLSLEKLCINIILRQVWNDDLKKINEIDFLLQDEIWQEKFKERHEIIKWCKNKIYH